LTARTWEFNARTDPLWSILADPRARGGRWDTEEFFRTGEQTVSALWEKLERLGSLPRRRRALDFGCGVARSTLFRLSKEANEKSVYHSGILILESVGNAEMELRQFIADRVTRALDEQKLNARGVVPQTIEHMPIFRYGGQLTANQKDIAEDVGSSVLPTARMTKQTGYICLQLENRTWRKKRTHDPGQPADGFTVSALEDQTQIDLLCQAYEKSDADGRKMIQLFAQLSIAEGEGISPGRFEP